MNRRDFLNNTGLALGASLTIPAISGFTGSSGENLLKRNSERLENWQDVRNQFLLEPDKIHMALMLLSSHPRQVRDAILLHRKNFDENPAEYWENNFLTAEPKVLESAAAYLQADPSEIALTDSTTQGLGTLYTGFFLRSGEEIITTIHDHYATERALEFAVIRNGASLKRVQLYKDPSEVTKDEIIGNLKQAITPKTRLVAITWVHSSTGVKLPVHELANVIKEENNRRNSNDRIYIAVDGVHGFGVEDSSMADLGCDFFIAGTHKWMFGPRGTGIMWAKKDAWHMITPVIPAFSQAYAEWLGLVPKEQLTFNDLSSPGGFHAFEHRWSLNEAFDFHMKIGKGKIQEQSRKLNSMLKEGLKNIPHVKLLTPLSSDLSAAINCFEVDGLKPEEVVKKLHAKKIIASTSPYRISYARLTPSVVNTEEEVQACLKAVEEII